MALRSQQEAAVLALAHWRGQVLPELRGHWAAASLQARVERHPPPLEGRVEAGPVRSALAARLRQRSKLA